MTPDELGEYGPVAVARMERALRFTSDHDLDGYYIHVLGGRARLWLERGDWAAALADADEALTSPALLGMNAVLPLVVRGRIEAARGDPHAAATLDEAARHAEGVEDVVMVAPVTDAQSELALWSGDAERAREVARQTPGRDPALRHQRVPRRPAGLPALAGRWRRPRCRSSRRSRSG